MSEQPDNLRRLPVPTPAPCVCRLWEQRWMPDAPHRCSNCGGLFDPKTVAARAPLPGEPWHEGFGAKDGAAGKATLGE